MVDEANKKTILNAVIGNVSTFVIAHWKKVLSTFLAIAAVIVATPSGILGFRELAERDKQSFERSILPGFELLVINKSNRSIRIKALGSFQYVLWGSSPSGPNFVSLSGRFLVGESLLEKATEQQFEMFPGEKMVVKGRFINQDHFANYTFLGNETETKIRFMLTVDGKVIMKEVPLFYKGRMLGYESAIPFEVR